MTRHESVNFIMEKFYDAFGLGDVCLENIEEKTKTIIVGTPGTVVNKKYIVVHLNIFKYIPCVIHINMNDTRKDVEQNIAEHIKTIDLIARNMLLRIDRYLLNGINRI